jgi:hypothetical protein
MRRNVTDRLQSSARASTDAPSVLILKYSGATPLPCCKRRSCLVGGPQLEFLLSGAVLLVCAIRDKQRSCPEAVVANRTESLPPGTAFKRMKRPWPLGGRASSFDGSRRGARPLLSDRAQQAPRRMSHRSAPAFPQPLARRPARSTAGRGRKRHVARTIWRPAARRFQGLPEQRFTGTLTLRSYRRSARQLGNFV